MTRKVTKSVIRSCNSRDRYNTMAKVEKKENPMPERFKKKKTKCYKNTTQQTKNWFDTQLKKLRILRQFQSLLWQTNIPYHSMTMSLNRELIYHYYFVLVIREINSYIVISGQWQLSNLIVNNYDISRTCCSHGASMIFKNTKCFVDRMTEYIRLVYPAE